MVKRHVNHTVQRQMCESAFAFLDICLFYVHFLHGDKAVVIKDLLIFIENPCYFGVCQIRSGIILENENR